MGRLGRSFKFPAKVQNAAWIFKEEVRSGRKKPGWISDPSKADGAVDRWISFEVTVCIGHVVIEYLMSYENIGATECELKGIKGSKVRIEGKWKVHASLAQTRVISVGTHACKNET